MNGMKIAACMALLSLPAASLASGSPALQLDQRLLYNANVITKQQAINIALQAVGGGTVISCVFEKEDHNAHWTVDILGKNAEYEVWVSPSGKVLRIITQPE